MQSIVEGNSSSSLAGAPLKIDYSDNDLSTALFNPNYTFSMDKYTCVREFYFVHIVFNYFIFLSGIGCFITRVVPLRYMFLHSWLGRVYILSIMWSTSSALLIHNTGLPLATIISFGAVMGGVTLGWIAILIHKEQIERAALNRVNNGIKHGGIKVDADVGTMILDAKVMIANSKTFTQRLFSWKALHGIVLFVSWFNIAGRIFASDQSGDFVCYTYPVYKPIDTKKFQGRNAELTLVPSADPNYDRLPWSNGVVSWSMQIIFGSMAGAIVVGGIFSFFAARRALNVEEGAQFPTSCEGVVSSDIKGRESCELHGGEEGIIIADDGLPVFGLNESTSSSEMSTTKEALNK